MKKIFSIFFILLSIKAYSQNTNPQFLGGANSNLIVQGIMNLADSPRASLNWILTDTNTAKSYFFTKLKGRWAREANGRLYYNPTGLRFVLADSVTGGGGSADSLTFFTNYRADTMRANLYAAISVGGLDTTSLSNRINDRVKYSDTATMLAPYALTSELTNQTGDAGNLQNLHITGTNGAGYLLLRHQASNPTASGQTSVVFADANGDLKWKNDNKFYTTLRDYKNTADRIYSFQDKSYTLADSAVVATKLNITDTATMLAPYLRDADTTAMLGVYLRKADTASLSNRINTKLNITDTANIRLRPIAGANMSITGTYPNLTFAAAGGGGSADSITFATNYRVDTAKANLRTSINSKLNATDTASLSTRIDARVKYTDTATMLVGYLRKVDTASLSNRINLKANTASPTFTGTVTIPTGANITTPNILGLSSGTTNDSIVVADPSTGALKRISSSRISSGGGGGISGSGTADFVPRFTASTTLGNGIIRDDGTNIGVGGNPYSVRLRAYGPIGVTGTTGPFAGHDQLLDPAGASISMGHNGTVGFVKSWASTPLVVISNIGIAVSNDGSATAPITNAVLDVRSTNKAFYPPRMTTSERDAMTGVQAGAMIYNTTVNKHQGWNGTTWNDMY